MANNFGATFVPGGFDDYYMPEVVAPAPQRCVAKYLSLNLPAPSIRYDDFFPKSPSSPRLSFVHFPFAFVGKQGLRQG
jgi:hypothetical protein